MVLAQDPFDKELNARISIWKKGNSGIFDDYGHQSQILTLLVEDIPARVDPGDGKELQTEAVFGIQNYTIFTRPLMVDDPPVPLNIHYWIQVNKYQTQKGVWITLVDPPTSDNQQLHDIKNVKNPGLIDHHLEIATQLIIP